MSQYIYRIQMKGGQWCVAVRPEWFMDLLQQVMSEDGMVSDDHWIIRGSEIASVTREEVTSC